MCRYCGPRSGVNTTWLMSTLVGFPCESRVNPCGEFIQALTERIENAPTSPMIGRGSPTSRCARGLIRFQP